MDALYKAFSMPFDPGQRIYWPFLLSALLVLYFWSGKKSFKDFLHPSSLLDFKVMSLNLVFKALLFPLFLFTSFEVSVGLLRLLNQAFPGFTGLEVTTFQASFMATVIAFVVNDFFRFFHHFLMHKLPGLKLFHRTHHSALVLTPFTLYRSHPVEAFIAGARNILSLGVILCLFSFLMQRPVRGFDILGINLFGFLFNALLSNLRHSPMPISFGILEYLFVSPRMHQIHHSNNPAHFGKNYGVALAIWDQLAGSFYRPSFKEARELTFGLHESLSEEVLEEATTLKGALLPKGLKGKKEVPYFEPVLPSSLEAKIEQTRFQES